jgi:hypothetical protein
MLDVDNFILPGIITRIYLTKNPTTRRGIEYFNIHCSTKLELAISNKGPLNLFGAPVRADEYPPGREL